MRKHRVLLKCLDLAFDYELNNVLHAVVLQSILSMCEEFDLATTVEDYGALFALQSDGRNLVDTILDAYSKSDELKAERGYQSCYLGHLHIMANAVHDASIKAAQIMEANPESSSLFGGVNNDGKMVAEGLSNIKPPPPSTGEDMAAQKYSDYRDGLTASPQSEYSASALKVAGMIVHACASNVRWRDFVDNRLPEINNRRKLLTL